MRDEVEYLNPSAFGPNIPRRIITTFYDKADKGSVRLSGRITYTYQEFKRFDVKTDYEIPEIRTRDRLKILFDSPLLQ